MVVLSIVVVIVVVVLGITGVAGWMAKKAPASVGPHYNDLEHQHPRFQDEDPTA